MIIQNHKSAERHMILYLLCEFKQDKKCHSDSISLQAIVIHKTEIPD